MQTRFVMLSFEQTLEAGLPELISADSPAKLAPESLEGLYAQAIVCFLRGDNASLQDVITRTSAKMQLTRDWIFIAAAMRLRLQIHNRVFDMPLIKVASVLANEDSRWQGELELLLAIYFTVQENHSRARNFFARAAGSFTRQGCVKKASRARMNAVICDHHISGWNKLGKLSEGPKLSPLEQRLVNYLSIRPRNRVDILEYLYGNQLEFETRLNRFKSLIGGLRRKIPGAVLCEDSLYRVDRPFFRSDT